MDPALRRETERLTRSWMRHDAGMLRDYLVASVEDPRINFQSILSRHFLIRAVAGTRFETLAEEEYIFSAVMNWLLHLAFKKGGSGEFEAVLHALRHNADNAEGTPIPRFVLRAFARLEAQNSSAKTLARVPNYIEGALSDTEWSGGAGKLPQSVLNTFRLLWAEALASWRSSDAPSVLEPACGSANDYRFLSAFGILRLVKYTGFDLCLTNVENARAMFPEADFRVGNVFEIEAPDRGFNHTFAHDLFEHLSEQGLHEALHEMCRVTRTSLCVHFFNMDEIPAHEIIPYEEYHWNRLGMDGMRRLFQAEGFDVSAVHIGTFLGRQLGCESTHNPNAYSFFMHRRADA